MYSLPRILRVTLSWGPAGQGANSAHYVSDCAWWTHLDPETLVETILREQFGCKYEAGWGERTSQVAQW